MTAEATTETVTVELNVESAYKQLVAHEKAYAAFVKADDEDDAEAKLSATNDAVQAAIEFINELIPQDVSDKLHARLAEEHPELAPGPALDLEALIKALGLDLAQ